MRSARIRSVDVTRGLVTLFMVLWHSAHGYLSQEARSGLLYEAVSFVALLPLAGFLYLAGTAIALRAAKGDEGLRRSVGFRGLRLLVGGYLLSVVYALITTPSGLSELLRADVLHVIGLSIALLSVGLSKGRERLRWWSASIVVVCLLAGPFLHRIAQPTGALRFVLGLFVDVKGVTYFPLVPLAAWTALGVFAPKLLSLPTKALIVSVLVLSLLSVAFYLGMHATHEALGGTLERSHLAISLNVLDVAARITVLLLLCELLCRYTEWDFPLLRFWGRNSLVMYAVHLPLCFGTLAHLTEHVRIISMEELPMTVAAVLAISSFVTLLWEQGQSRWRQRSA